MNFEPYPFEKLHSLLQNIEPNSNYKPLTLTIGEPQFPTPAFIQEALCESSELLQKYPKTTGESYLREAMRGFVKTRFGVTLEDSQIIPTFGTRELLFNFPQFLLFDKKDAIMAFTNPFYQIYEGAALASKAKVIHLNLTQENNYTPTMTPQQLQEVDLVILNFPNNPTSATLSRNELVKWVQLALEYDFILLNDECYSEIYTSTPPPSLLEASKEAGNETFKNILVLNSVSKRSCAPGLRSGFIAGDAEILKNYMKYRTYVGCASPLPLQKAAAAAWSDEEHVKISRKVYTRNFELAKEILNTPIPQATFYIWLRVDNPLTFTQKLYKEYNLKVLPGEFLARKDAQGQNPGENYIRIALVENEENTKDALLRIKECLGE
jgi:aspartate/methionine/tyrosine aminotransferase